MHAVSVDELATDNRWPARGALSGSQVFDDQSDAQEKSGYRGDCEGEKDL